MLAITGGKRPSRPAHPGLTDGLWALTRRCWDQETHRRPHVLRISSDPYASAPEPPVTLPDQFLTCSNIPAWKYLIDHPLSAVQRVSLITEVFSDRDETEAVKCLRGRDAQSFIDVIDEVLSDSLTSEDSADLNPNFPVSPGRCWIA